MSYTIHTYRTGDIEAVRCKLDDEEVASVFTSSDSPEDNSCSRLGIAAAFESVIRSAGLPVERIQHDYGEEPWNE